MENREQFDHYRVLRDADGKLIELGRGVASVTYMAKDVNLRREVALKVVKSEGLQHARTNLNGEARAAAVLRHRNVAAIHHLGADKSHFFYAMEYVDGETADAWVNKRGPLRPIDALKVALQVAQALIAASRCGFTHRDIKPSNVMLRRSDDGEWPVVKVIDFGLATPIQSEHPVIATNGFEGTAQYASPEQAREDAADARTDVYSLGCTLWFLLTGEPPFEGSLASIFAQHLKTPPPIRKLKGVPRSIRKLLLLMLEKNAANRPYPTEAAKRIQNCLKPFERKETVMRQFGAPLIMAKAGWTLLPTRLRPALIACALLLISAVGIFGFRTIIQPVSQKNSTSSMTAPLASATSPTNSSLPSPDLSETSDEPATLKSDQPEETSTSFQTAKTSTPGESATGRKASVRSRSSRAVALRRNSSHRAGDRARKALGYLFQSGQD